MSRLFDSVSTLKGVGPARAKLLHNLGIDTLYDLIAFFPRSYEDRRRMVSIDQLEVDVPACFTAMVVSSPHVARIRAGLELLKVRVADDSAALNLTFFNQSYLKDTLHYGERFVFYGTLAGDGLGYQMTNPIVEPLDRPGGKTRRIVPVYPLTAGISGRQLSQYVTQALDACLDSLPDVLPAALRQQYGLCGAAQAYRTVHNPPSFEALDTARHRLIFEEFFIFSAGLSLMRSRSARFECEPIRSAELTPFWQALPFPPTGAQRRAVEEIRADLQRGFPMRRLLQGDVGSGKTLVAAAAIYLAAQNGLQAALMAPTEILAEQHFRWFSQLFAGLGIRVVLLTGSSRAQARREAEQALADGTATLAVGTHALLSEGTVFSRLGLVVADEQHRFGVAQRSALAQKGLHPHMLVMSATPIPRTLSLIVYGDLDVSVLDELPPGPQPVDTFLVGESMRPRVNRFIRKHVEEGHQCYIICPAIEEGELDSVKSAALWAETLQRTVFPDLRLALLHGKLRGPEKEAVMADFAAGRTDILVATTVVEVGVDVPNATLIVIENAERFGLSQLHQLRGRVGRGQDKSYCILISTSRNAETVTRLKALCKTNDGFEIAREDLALRGPGDLFGSRQHGLPAFKVANLAVDLQTLQKAQQAAAALLQREDLAQLPEYQPLLARIHSLFAQQADTLN